MGLKPHRVLLRLEQLGWTQRRLANIMHRPHTTINGWCTGHRDPRSADLHELSRTLRVPMDWLCGNDEYTSWKPENDI
ncbi:helix-turn-helix domain-containing protein [Sansalvadorimonas verongulae]|uniref:helix-turn-helix domain-containing protein n=1 Tax=Sansalvadorimonas verongulae TaxID=2172824 RepID=UPI0012BCF220|nr:helix-turn-helix transcriptional regulator [Sansalvadorimonas verongulae]MTI13378.1 XRE family transcriptional regulator [Sansalvadorimonas verongulae]